MGFSEDRYFEAKLDALYKKQDAEHELIEEKFKEYFSDDGLLVEAINETLLSGSSEAKAALNQLRNGKFEAVNSIMELATTYLYKSAARQLAFR